MKPLTKLNPRIIHLLLYLVIAILSILLIKVVIIDPKNIIEREKYYKRESRLRMENIRQAQVLYQKKYSRFTDNLDSLIKFIKTDRYVMDLIKKTDSLSGKSLSPFKKLSNGIFSPDSLFRTPKSFQKYILLVDTTETGYTIKNQSGKTVRLIQKKIIGSKYYLNDPDGYGSVGSLSDDALKNVVSWE